MVNRSREVFWSDTFLEAAGVELITGSLDTMLARRTRHATHGRIMPHKA